jgi:hypothetical protein
LHLLFSFHLVSLNWFWALINIFLIASAGNLKQLIFFYWLLMTAVWQSSSSVICHTTGPQPLPKRFLHLMRSRASSSVPKVIQQLLTSSSSSSCHFYPPLYLFLELFLYFSHNLMSQFWNALLIVKKKQSATFCDFYWIIESSEIPWEQTAKVSATKVTLAFQWHGVNRFI